MQKQPRPQEPEPFPRILFIRFNEYGQIEARTRLVLTAAEVAEALTLSAQKVRWMMLHGELPSFHFGSRRVVSLEALEHYIHQCDIEAQQERLSFLQRYSTYFGFGKPHPEIQQAQERLNVMQSWQGPPAKEQPRVPISSEPALYYITITESGRLECSPRWLLSMQEVAQLLGISRAMIWELSKDGDFPVFRINRRVFVRVESLLGWIRAKEHPRPEQPAAIPASTKNKKAVKPQTKKRRNS